MLHEKELKTMFISQVLCILIDSDNHVEIKLFTFVPLFIKKTVGRAIETIQL